MGVKLKATSGGTLTVNPADTASEYTLTLPAQTGTVVATDSSGNVGISGTLLVGTATGHGILTVAQNNTKMWVDCQSSYIEQSMTDSSASNIDWYQSTKGTGAFIWRQSGTTEVVRIDPQGYLQAHAGTGSLTGANYHSFRTSTGSSTWVMYQRHETGTSGNAYGTKIEYRNVAPNGTGNEFLFCSDMSSTRATIRSNGGLANYSANNANLSDERTKTDINLAGNYLDKICSIPVKTFKYKDQTDNELNLGVIAQDVESVAPELVDVSGFGETPEDGIPLKAIYQTDLQYALMKCIQEQQLIIIDLKARIEVLENKQ